VTTAAQLSHEDAIAAAQESYSLEPEDGWRFHEGKTEPWSGWRCSFVDRRRRPRKVHVLIYNEEISREAAELAIRYWFDEVGR
jgi:hypothetical protein